MLIMLLLCWPLLAFRINSTKARKALHSGPSLLFLLSPCYSTTHTEYSYYTESLTTGWTSDLVAFMMWIYGFFLSLRICSCLLCLVSSQYLRCSSNGLSLIKLLYRLLVRISRSILFILAKLYYLYLYNVILVSLWSPRNFTLSTSARMWAFMFFLASSRVHSI